MPDQYFELAKSLISDPHNDCRWQALIVIGEYVESQPEAVWRVIQEFGVSRDEDMRNGIATVLLEHLLEHHLDTYLPKLRKAVRQSSLLADTLIRCEAFGEAKGRWDEIRRLAGPRKR